MRDSVDRDARELRGNLNKLQEGAGAVTRRVDELRERLGQLKALQEADKTLLRQLDELTSTRANSYAELDRLRDERFLARQKTAARLSSELAPTIRIEVFRSAHVDSFIQDLASALRGSGIHYNRIAPLITTSLSPLELVEAAETGTVEVVTHAAQIPHERAALLLRHLRTEATPDLISTDIDDAVSLYLLDGSEEKPTDRLSIGQRCTVVLPILLSGHGGVLVVDQPEDHLDNAFITETLVERLRTREPSDQMIFASHNPNVPVLGEADHVVSLDSDGRRGFVSHVGALDAPGTVRAITSIMEGGAEAFARRAAFYESVRRSPDEP
jgi:hypothetical protein